LERSWNQQRNPPAIGAPTQALTRAAASASMLVVGSRGAGSFSALLLGSVSRYVATHAPCPVVVAREDSMGVRREVAVGIGDPGQPSHALSFAFEEASLRKVGLLALHAWHWPWPGTGPLGTPAAAERAAIHASQTPSDIGTELEDMLASVRGSYPEVEVRTEVADAHPARMLAEASARADLVVIGWHPTGAAGAAGSSVTHGLLGHAHGPVAVIPRLSGQPGRLPARWSRPVQAYRPGNQGHPAVLPRPRTGWN
jgi:nucleotide-binding universal stress UspA family protein